MADKTRTGARSFLDEARHMCKLSHTPGFVSGLNAILGLEEATAIYAVWTPFCQAVELAMALDNWFNRVDATSEATGDEDVELA